MKLAAAIKIEDAPAVMNLRSTYQALSVVLSLREKA